MLYVFEMRSQRRLNGGGTRPVLQVRARWVPDLGGFRFYCTHTSGFSATGCCGGEAVPSSAMRHIFWKPEAGPLRMFTAGAVGISVYVACASSRTNNVNGVLYGAVKCEIATWHCDCVVLLYRYRINAGGMWAVAHLPT